MLGVMSSLDLQTVFDASDGSITESEALEVKALLIANGIHAVTGSEGPIASLGHEVRVARKDFNEAKRVIAEARGVGRLGADEAERQSES
jgi:hypothetical protein